ncbi:MAG: hypothetical protein ACNA7Q_12115 [Rhodobacterales bacterium]
MSNRQQIIDALVTRLKTIVAGDVITLDNDEEYTYATSAGSAVEEWRTTPLEQKEPFALVVYDQEARKTIDDDTSIGYQRHALQIDIVVVTQQATPLAMARAMMADVSACIGIDPTFGGLAAWTQIISDSLDMDAKARVYAGARVSIEITYDTPLWQM